MRIQSERYANNVRAARTRKKNNNNARASVLRQKCHSNGFTRCIQMKLPNSEPLYLYTCTRTHRNGRKKRIKRTVLSDRLNSDNAVLQCRWSVIRRPCRVANSTHREKNREKKKVSLSVSLNRRVQPT